MENSFHSGISFAFGKIKYLHALNLEKHDANEITRRMDNIAYLCIRSVSHGQAIFMPNVKEANFFQQGEDRFGSLNGKRNSLKLFLICNRTDLMGYK